MVQNLLGPLALWINKHIFTQQHVPGAFSVHVYIHMYMYVTAKTVYFRVFRGGIGANSWGTKLTRWNKPRVSCCCYRTCLYCIYYSAVTYHPSTHTLTCLAFLEADSSSRSGQSLFPCDERGRATGLSLNEAISEENEFTGLDLRFWSLCVPRPNHLISTVWILTSNLITNQWRCVGCMT